MKVHVCFGGVAARPKLRPHGIDLAWRQGAVVAQEVVELRGVEHLHPGVGAKVVVHLVFHRL